VGTIVDANTGARVKEAFVLLVLRQPNPVTSAALSAADGEFEFNYLQPGLYDLQVEKNGYRTSSETDLVVTLDTEVALTGSHGPEGRQTGLEGIAKWVSPGSVAGRFEMQIRPNRLHSMCQ
jgi:hypothetical protein